MNNVEKSYEELLKTADKISDMYDDNMTDDELDEFFKSLDENIVDSAQLLPSNNGVVYNENTDPSQNIVDTVLVSANPVTGALNTIPYVQNNLTEESVDEIINLKCEDYKKIEIGWDAFVENTKAMYPSATEEGLRQLLNCVNKYRQHIKFSYFNECPDFVKKEIIDYVNAGIVQRQASRTTVNQLRNMLAKELFDTIITNNYSSKAYSDLSKYTISQINKGKEELKNSINDYNANLRKEYEEGFIKKAEILENSDEEGAKETAANLREASRMFTQSYTYEEMYEAYKNRKIKVKNIQIDKFNRTCQEFNRKYYNNNLQIKDVGMTVGVLDRVLDKKYNINAIKKFIVLFINYTKNFNPSNIPQHVFMYYFIQHILALDINIPGNDYETFNDLLKENIYKFLDLIIERDNEKEEVKKGMK